MGALIDAKPCLPAAQSVCKSRSVSMLFDETKVEVDKIVDVSCTKLHFHASQRSIELSKRFLNGEDFRDFLVIACLRSSCQDHTNE